MPDVGLHATGMSHRGGTRQKEEAAQVSCRILWTISEFDASD